MKTKSYLFLFTIGPVQSFICNSRKMRDLYAGSFLLSYLILKACEAIQKSTSEVTVKRVIPAISDQDSAKIPNVPNRILLKVKFNVEKNYDKWMEEQAKALICRVREEFESIYEKIFEECDIKSNDSIEKQLELFPEVYWAYEEYKDKSSFEKITYKIQAVKTIRPFTQTKEPAARKCSLFPEYNALLYRSKEKKVPNYIADEAIEYKGKDFYSLKPGEALCSLAFIKRMFYRFFDKNSNSNYNKEINSVAYMLLKDCYLDEFPKNGQIFMKEYSQALINAAEAVFDLQNGATPSQEVYKEEDIDIAEKFYEKINDKRISPYYAVIKFDGDGMGEVYRKCDEGNQTDLSEDIAEFAKTVPEIMEKYHGMCIYAGGDDFLGFFPAMKAIPAFIKLREKFHDIENPLGGKMTFSAGIVFAHLMPPLKNVLALVDDMEQLAKRHPGKDSFAIAVYKRSGKGSYVCNKYGDNCENLKILSEIFNLLNTEALSTSSVYNLLSVVDKLQKGDEKYDQEMLRQIIVSSICSLTDKNQQDDVNSKMIFELFEKYNFDLHKATAALDILTFLRKEV